VNKPLDGIVLSTPTFTHGEYIRQAADAKVSVFTEKPVDETADKIQKTFEYAHKAGIQLCCGFQRRFDPSYVATKRALQSGQIGDPLVSNIFFADHPCPPKEFLMTGGNIFMDLSTHDVDFITDALQDRVISVYASGTSSDSDLETANVHDSATMVMKMSKGKLKKKQNMQIVHDGVETILKSYVIFLIHRNGRHTFHVTFGSVRI